jgi:hypothetical protein
MPDRFRFLRSVLIVVLVVVSIPLLSAPQHSSFIERMTTPPAAIAQSAAPVGPQPGDVFRQFQDNTLLSADVCVQRFGNPVRQCAIRAATPGAKCRSR